MLSELSELKGVSGAEQEIRRYLTEKLNAASLKVNTDSMGNLLVRKGNKNSRLMLAAHMDEVGLMIMGFEKNGLLKFSPVGGLDHRILPGKRVIIGNDNLPGVIGVKPIHLQKKNEQEKPFEPESLFIDAGFKNSEEAEKYIVPGDYVSFSASFAELETGIYRGKAFDDRVGCYILLKLLLEDNGLSFSAAFTVQEEIGTRGAAVAAFALNPSEALVLEATAAADTPGTRTEESSTALGKGAVISIMDRTIIISRKLREELTALAENNAITYQYRQFTGAGTEGGVISLSRSGVETAVVAVPCRYIHSPHSIACEDDINAAFKLVKAWLAERN